VDDAYDLATDDNPAVLRSVEISEPVVALTIDDGPDPHTTPEILRVLAAHEARATFFLLSERIPGNESLMDAIVAGGHEIANHGTRDVHSIDLEDDAFERDLQGAHAALSVWTEPRWFRPGAGFYDEVMLQTLGRHGYRLALGSSYPFDAQLPWVWLASRWILWDAEPGEVIILHDGGERGARTARTLDRVLGELQRRGYEVVTLSELVGRARPAR
jgi:peptidoglycan/xylan/chitin deacetylase (PgdA/CDA1 family)